MSEGAPRPRSACCHRCGADKVGPLVPCKGCGYTPTGEARPVAWLFSLQHLSPDELVAAAERIRAGDRPDPSRGLRESARIAMGAQPLDADAMRPLSNSSLVLLALANLLLTPLTGFAIWWGLRETRPTAARQALRITAPVAVALSVLWVGVILGGLIP